ncbi:hypothetical protein JMUB7556_28290 [Staphylococcus aureus]
MSRGLGDVYKRQELVMITAEGSDATAFNELYDYLSLIHISEPTRH